MITDNDLDNWFKYHSPTPEQIPKYQEIRNAARVLAEVILDNTPSCADQTATFRLLRETVMSANQTVACNS